MVTSQSAAPVAHLTWNEICVRYPNQWVALADIAWVNRTDFAFSRGHRHVRGAQGGDTHEKELRATNRRSVGCFFTGKLIKSDVDPLWHAGP